MKGKDVDLIITILKLLCPYLKDMAARTENKVDDVVVHFVCRLLANIDHETVKEDT